MDASSYASRVTMMAARPIPFSSRSSGQRSVKPGSAARLTQSPDVPPCVVVVDDDGDLLEMLAEIFESDGFRVAPCRTAVAAIAALTSAPPDLVVTDVLLRDHSECAIVHWLDEHHLPLAGVIILTGMPRNLMERDEALVQRLGARVMAKPFVLDDLLQAARDITGWRGQF